MVKIAILYRNKKYYDINIKNCYIYVNNKKAKLFYNSLNLPCLKIGLFTVIEDITIISNKLKSLNIAI